MKKIKYILNLKTSELEESFKGEGILENNKLFLKNNEDILNIDLKNNIFFRESDQVVLNYYFNENERSQGTIYIKELKQELGLEIETKEIVNKDNYIKFEFEILDNDNFVIEIEYEVEK